MIDFLNLKADEIILEKYRIIKEIGKGGMNSIIYLALDTTIKEENYYAKTNKYVAIKIVNKNDKVTEDEWIKLTDECFTASRLQYKKNIVNTYCVNQVNNNQTIIIVMEYIDGISLREYLNQRGCLSINEATYIFKNILYAVKELHDLTRKIIHRDLKPENIILSKDYKNIKVIDFGISTVIQNAKQNEKTVLYTNEKSIYGTYPYICPDIFKLVDAKDDHQKAAIINEQFDFYSLGVIFYEMITGEKPFFSDNYDNVDVIKLPLTYDLPIVHDFDNEVPIIIENIIFKCMACKKEDLQFRYHSINEIIADVQLYENDDVQLKTLPLIKPKNMRIFQTKNVFNIEAQKQTQKFYYQNWFFWIISALILVIIILSILVVCLDILPN